MRDCKRPSCVNTITSLREISDVSRHHAVNGNFEIRSKPEPYLGWNASKAGEGSVFEGH